MEEAMFVYILRLKIDDYSSLFATFSQFWYIFKITVKGFALLRDAMIISV